MMIHWEKPSGVMVETNDRKDTIAYCEKLGWKSMEVEDPIPEGMEAKDPNSDGKEVYAGAPDVGEESGQSQSPDKPQPLLDSINAGKKKNGKKVADVDIWH
ncbi:hypothetical protein IID62_06980 [candidate division KSB1 bacterium]|nr:hypothetical protein [candidate division KSB1 bacterium]